MSKSKKNRNIALILVTTLICLGVVTMITLPNMVASTFEKQAISLGVDPNSLKQREKRWNAIRYTNLRVGSNGDSTIDSVTLYFDAKTLVNKTIKSLSIDGMYISGDINVNGKISLKGLEQAPDISNLNKINAEQISIKNANFSLLSAHFGGLRGIINLSGRRKGDTISWTGNIDSRQDQLELIAKINAQTNNSERWLVDIQIENAKLERSFGKFTRVNGILNMTGEEKSLNALNAELSAGALNAYGTSWQNASVTINNQTGSAKVYVSAKSSGIDGLELNVEAQPSHKTINWNANIFSETGFKLAQYLKSQGMLPLNQEALREFADIKNVTLQLKPIKNSLIFKVKNESESIDIKGKIERKNSQAYQSTFKKSENILKDINGAKCQNTTQENTQICQIDLIKKNKKFLLTIEPKDNHKNQK